MLAVRVGFEPTEPFQVHFFSKEALSTTQPSHRYMIEYLEGLILVTKTKLQQHVNNLLY